MEIMKLIPSGKDYLWGGTRLKDEYGKKIEMTPLAESWECSVHPDGPCYVANGRYKGKILKFLQKFKYRDAVICAALCSPSTIFRPYIGNLYLYSLLVKIVKIKIAYLETRYRKTKSCADLC